MLAQSDTTPKFLPHIPITYLSNNIKEGSFDCELDIIILLLILLFVTIWFQIQTDLKTAIFFKSLQGSAEIVSQ